AVAFAEAYRGKLDGLDGAELAAAIAAFERLDERLSRLMSYAQLVYAAEVNNAEVGRFYQTLNERVTEISANVLFFRLELNRIDDVALNERLAAPKLAAYRPWLDDVRAFKPHELSDEAERLLHEKHVAGRAAWVRLFDETAAALRFTVDGEQLTMAEVLSRLMDHDPAKREAAAHAVADELKRNIRLFSLITNTLAKDKEIEDQWRRYDRPVSARNLSNQVEDEVVDALASAVTSAYPRLSHRYYHLKAKWFGTEQLNYWDRNAPLPQGPDRMVAWGEAVDTVLTAYAGFSDELAAVGRRFFDNAWIDAPARPGKASGAFAHPTVPSAHPYLLLNYQGKTRDVMTLAHELGHGVHQVLAADQGHLLCRTPLTLAETASVFGEMLTFQAMLAAETDPARRKAMLAQKVEDMLNTVVRQISFYEFERRLHDARRESELLPDQIGEIWMEVSRESLGPGIRLDAEYAVYWAHVPHFIHSPFYVYAYAFGDCLVNSLYAVYQQAEAGFAEKYLELLRAGGSKRHKELLAPFGLDASDPAFWDKGLGVIERFLDELEAMD
ncbi:MAG: M3 family oligoendopeptidase, partial [Alphaproteobacteria bacterium]|nr:M3 family oligoendopeptidase [Alphaproteobacteria bacterium]